MFIKKQRWGHGGAVVSTLDFRSEGGVVSLGKCIKWVPATYCGR